MKEERGQRVKGEEEGGEMGRFKARQPDRFGHLLRHAQTHTETHYTHTHTHTHCV